MNLFENRERIVVLISTILFFGAFGAITLMDQSHGTIGDELEIESVNAKVIENHGNFKDIMIPEGLLIFGAGQEASLDFQVFNQDPDNDIDSIEISIPNSEMTDGSSQWYQSEFTHEWSFETTSDDVGLFSAQDDWFGRVIGGSAQYDVVGNLDDALDYFSVNSTISQEISEGITLTVDFVVPSTPGIKMGQESIDLKVGDLLSESTGSLVSIDESFPFPYIVAENGSKYLVMILENEDCDLEVMYGSEQLFSPTRGNDFMVSDYGFKYNTTEGKTVVVLNEPENKVVKPLIKAKENGLTGQFTLDIFNITVEDIILGTFDIVSIVADYSDNIPVSMDTLIDLDLDNDGFLNLLDDDMDGDGILNDVDLFPKIYNRLPVVVSITDNTSVVETEALTLTVSADDPDDETVTYFWTNDIDTSWNSTSNTVVVSDLVPGTYVFTVKITDELGNIETDMVTVNVIENQSPVIGSVSALKSEITTGEDLILKVNATDNENDPLTYSWSMDGDTGFSKQGSEITVMDLEKGTYRFTVSISDGNSEVQDSITITVKEDEEEPSIIPILIIVFAVIFLILVIIVIFFLVKKKGSDENGLELESPQVEMESETEDDHIEYSPQMDQYSEVPTQEEPVVMVEDNQPLQQPEYEIHPEPVPADDVVEEDLVDENEGCPECGAQMSDTDEKCPSCGAEFEIEMVCGICGEIIPEGQDKCPLCETKI